MPFQPAPGVAKVTLTFNQGDQIAQNIFHVKTTEEWGAEFLENLVGVFYTWYQNNLQATQSVDVTLTTIEARDLTTEFAGYNSMTLTTDNTGAIANPVLPYNSTAAVKWTTGLTGRSTRGRTYHVGLSESSATGGELTSAARVALLDAYEQLIEDVSTAEIAWSLAVLSRVQDGVPLANAIAYDILDVACDFALDSQRRRLPGRGV
jgi:hypothetical protein